MPVYTYRVTAVYWIDVEADDETTAEQLAMENYEDGSYDGIDEAKLMGVEEDE
jgi:hypothetical protein